MILAKFEFYSIYKLLVWNLYYQLIGNDFFYLFKSAILFLNYSLTLGVDRFKINLNLI